MLLGLAFAMSVTVAVVALVTSRTCAPRDPCRSFGVSINALALAAVLGAAWVPLGPTPLAAALALASGAVLAAALASQRRCFLLRALVEKDSPATSPACRAWNLALLLSLGATPVLAIRVLRRALA